MKPLLYCMACARYTLKDTCTCGTKTQSPRPAKYSIDDKYAEYRRKAKEQQHGMDGKNA